MIKKLVGKLTKPKFLAIFVDNCGEVTYWKIVGGMPSFNREGKMFLDYSHKFTYIKMEQDWLGVWREKQEYWGRNKPLLEV